MKPSLIRITMGVLSLLPALVVNEILHRYAPDCWAPAWGKVQCLEVIEDILLSR